MKRRHSSETINACKILTPKKNYFFGAAIGFLITLSVINTSLIVAPLITVSTFLKKHLTKKGCYILLLSLILTAWIIFKWVLVGGFGRHTLQDIYIISILTIFSIFTLKKSVLTGMTIVVSLLVFLDFINNFFQLTTGIDLFGNTPDSARADGVRLVGTFGHSFISLGLYFSLFLLLNAAGFKKLVTYIPLLLMLMIGSFRGFIFFPLLVFFSYVFLKRWRFVFFIILAVPLFVASATVLSVTEGLLSDVSGNAFRIEAWKNAINLIKTNPGTGLGKAPEQLPSDFSVSQENLMHYQIYESNFLQDAVRYGLIFVCIKLLFLYAVGSLHYKRRTTRSNQLADSKNFIVSFAIIDYFIFSYFGMPATALVAGIILGTKQQEY